VSRLWGGRSAPGVPILTRLRLPRKRRRGVVWRQWCGLECGVPRAWQSGPRRGSGCQRDRARHCSQLTCAHVRPLSDAAVDSAGRMSGCWGSSECDQLASQWVMERRTRRVDGPDSAALYPCARVHDACSVGWSGHSSAELCCQGRGGLPYYLPLPAAATLAPLLAT